MSEDEKLGRLKAEAVQRFAERRHRLGARDGTPEVFDDEVDAILHWMEEVEVKHKLYQMVLSGEVTIASIRPDGELVFHSPEGAAGVAKAVRDDAGGPGEDIRDKHPEWFGR